MSQPHRRYRGHLFLFCSGLSSLLSAGRVGDLIKPDLLALTLLIVNVGAQNIKGETCKNTLQKNANKNNKSDKFRRTKPVFLSQ